MGPRFSGEGHPHSTQHPSILQTKLTHTLSAMNFLNRQSSPTPNGTPASPRELCPRPVQVGSPSQAPSDILVYVLQYTCVCAYVCVCVYAHFRCLAQTSTFPQTYNFCLHKPQFSIPSPNYSLTQNAHTPKLLGQQQIYSRPQQLKLVSTARRWKLARCTIPPTQLAGRIRRRDTILIPR